MKLNVCCGGRILDGWVNIDVAETPPKKLDIKCDARHIPLDDGSADEIMCIHGFEHFYRWEVDELIEEWKRLLQPGGKLILELPDLMKCCRNILEGFTKAGKHPDQAGMWGLYGDPRTKNPFMSHRWGWSPQTLSAFLQEHGFRAIRQEPTVFHPIGRERRDMRLVAIRP